MQSTSHSVLSDVLIVAFLIASPPSNLRAANF
jgi:hypothetical protein